MPKSKHEFRDPIHNFIYVESYERKVIDSDYFQRLRYIHQLALTYLVYPGASHKRFEHSLGVMELASRVYDVITDKNNITDEIKNLCPDLNNDNQIIYWKEVVRMAALCHDLGHLPFSHAAEGEILPGKLDHEDVTKEIITTKMKECWDNITPTLNPEHIARIALGPKKFKSKPFSAWERVLTDIITGDALGVDRMDYLLRDSYHVGVAYGKFDHYRLIDSIRILPYQPDIRTEKDLYLGVEEGGLNSTEALMLARYYMFNQVYLHKVRRIYDIHLKEYIIEWLRAIKKEVDTEFIISLTDNEILSSIRSDCNDDTKRINHLARLIQRRKHFKPFYVITNKDIELNSEAGQVIYEFFSRKFGKESIKYDKYPQKVARPDFPVRLKDGNIISSQVVSEVLKHIPFITLDTLYCDRDVEKEVISYHNENKINLLKGVMENE